MRITAWVEGELLGEFDDVESALAEAALASHARAADVIVEAGDRELVVRVEVRDPA